MSSYTCRPDPDNPGKQICVRSEQSDSFDPVKGRSSRHKSSEEQLESGNGGMNPFGLLGALTRAGADLGHG